MAFSKIGKRQEFLESRIAALDSRDGGIFGRRFHFAFSDFAQSCNNFAILTLKHRLSALEKLPSSFCCENDKLNRFGTLARPSSTVIRAIASL
jgi:hypothetical protein